MRSESAIAAVLAESSRGVEHEARREGGSGSRAQRRAARRPVRTKLRTGCGWQTRAVTRPRGPWRRERLRWREQYRSAGGSADFVGRARSTIGARLEPGRARDVPKAPLPGTTRRSIAHGKRHRLGRGPEPGRSKCRTVMPSERPRFVHKSGFPSSFIPSIERIAAANLRLAWLSNESTYSQSIRIGRRKC